MTKRKKQVKRGANMAPILKQAHNQVKRLMDEFGLTAEEIGAAIGVKRGTVEAAYKGPHLFLVKVRDQLVALYHRERAKYLEARRVQQPAPRVEITADVTPRVETMAELTGPSILRALPEQRRVTQGDWLIQAALLVLRRMTDLADFSIEEVRKRLWVSWGWGVNDETETSWPVQEAHLIDCWEFMGFVVRPQTLDRSHVRFTASGWATLVEWIEQAGGKYRDLERLLQTNEVRDLIRAEAYELRREFDKSKQPAGTA